METESGFSQAWRMGYGGDIETLYSWSQHSVPLTSL